MSSQTASVLAIDDNAITRKSIAKRLGSRGFRVVTAADGPHALLAVERETFDLVLLDLKMPGMDGNEVLRTLRARYTTAELPVIVLAASDDRCDIARSLELGANDYIVKPGDLPVLVARINTQLSLRDAAHKPAPDADGAGLERRFRAMYDHTPVSCFALDGELRIRFANRFALQLFGYLAPEIVGRPVAMLYPAADRPAALAYLHEALARPAQLHRRELHGRKKSGELLWMRETTRVLGDDADTLPLMTCEDANEVYSLSAKLSYQVSHDDLTGVANRKAFEERLSRVLDSAHSEGSCHALAVLDIDQFKVVNDAYGHDAGDELLREVARRLPRVIRKRDTLARIGSDEFGLLLEDCLLSDAVAIADAARGAIESAPFEWAGARYPISASIGVVALDANCDTAMSALGMADAACYAAKDSGRNRLHVYQPGDTKVAARHGEMRWVARIGDALRSDRFELSLQEILPIAGDEAGDHYELLVRMRDERGGLILPSEFLAAAERYRLAAELDRWVIEHALAWLSAHPAPLSQLRMCSINLSGQSFCSDETLAFILERIAHYGIAPSKLCFEVTETTAIADLAHAARFICTLRERGCRFALDDFGSGFSSFGYLKNLPVDFVKIDGGFVRDIASDSVDLAMVKSINDIGHVMGKKTIAEFVEDADVLTLLKAIGVDYVQGFQIGRPVPLARYYRSTPDA